MQQELSVEKDLARHETYPFVVRFAEGLTPVSLGGLRDLLRETYRMVGQPFDYFPDHPIVVILYPEHDFYKIRTQSHQVAGLYDGKIRLPLRANGQTSQELQRILWHEYTHAVIHDFSKGRCPKWLNEGLATVQEARVVALDLAPVKTALQAEHLPSWASLWAWSDGELSDEALVLRYGQASLIAQYLVKLRGWIAMKKVLVRLGDGATIEAALKAEYRRTPAELEQEWSAWVRRELHVTR